MRKKLLAMTLVAAMFVGALAGCGKSDGGAEATTEGYDDGYMDVQVDAEKYVELGEYKNLHIKGTPVEVDEEELDARLEEDLLNYSTYETVDRKNIEADDIVNVDVVCTVKGETVDDLSNSDWDVQLGGGEIEFFDDAEVEPAILAAKVGDTVKVSGTFSEEVYSEMAAGQKGDMEIKINSIAKEVIPELNDKFVQENMDYKNVEEYKNAVREEMKSEAESYSDEENKYLLLDKAVENSKIIADFPADIIEAERFNCILDVKTMADYYGIEVGETDEELDAFFQESYGKTVDEYVIDALKRRCVVDLILKAEKVEVTDEEINQVVQSEMESGGYQSEEEFFEGTSKDDIRSELEQQKIFDILSASAVIE